VTSDAIHVLRGYGDRHAVRDDAFYVPRLMLERWDESGSIEGYRGGFRRTPARAHGGRRGDRDRARENAVLKTFADLSTPLVADACVRSEVPLRAAPPGIGAVIPGPRIAGRRQRGRVLGGVQPGRRG
jgi:hypothetical protein